MIKEQTDRYTKNGEWLSSKRHRQWMEGDPTSPHIKSAQSDVRNSKTKRAQKRQEFRYQFTAICASASKEKVISRGGARER